MTIQETTVVQAVPSEVRPRFDLVWIYRALFLVSFLGLWQLASGRLVDPFWISSPSDIGSTLFQWSSSGLLQRHLFVTFQETIIGFCIGSTLGVFSALAIGSNDMLRRTVDPFLTAVYGVPKVALAPLFIMWFGIGLAPKIVLAAVSVFFLVFFSTISGIAQVDRKMVDGLRIMGASRMTVRGSSRRRALI